MIVVFTRIAWAFLLQDKEDNDDTVLDRCRLVNLLEGVGTIVGLNKACRHIIDESSIRNGRGASQEVGILGLGHRGNNCNCSRVVCYDGFLFSPSTE